MPAADVPRWPVVVPTLVGMDRIDSLCPSESRSCPHARGDRPTSRHPTHSTTSLSPRSWGWTVTLTLPGTQTIKLSPRSWGWTAAKTSSSETPQVVPTLVGMDRACAEKYRENYVVPTLVGMDRDAADGGC